MSELGPVVFLIDDDPSVRRAIARLLTAEHFRVETFESGVQFLESGKAGIAECLIVDLMMPGMSGLELHEQLTAESIDTPVVFLTAHGDIPTGVRAMKEGAIDFLTKPVDDTDLLAAVRRGVALCASTSARTAELQEIRGRERSLTPREREVMGLVASGMLNKQIAYELGTSEKTIKVHRARVMEKMRVSSVAALVRLVDRLADSARSSHHGRSAV